MKILFLHLSDFHIRDKQGVNVFQLHKIADATNSFTHIDHIAIILSGDIAFSGLRHQYESAYHCIGNIISRLKSNGFSGQCYVLCVPGNHDVDHGVKARTSRELQAIRKVDSYRKHLDTELFKQKSFFSFAKRNNCFLDEGVFYRRSINLGGFTIEAILLNSGVFSILEEDKGLHYIPQHLLNDIETPTNADFVITIMHHSPDWYADNQKNILESIIFKKSSIVFLGHEHYIGKRTISYEENPMTLVQSGGKLADNADWTNSAFHIGILDSVTLKYTQCKLAWNANQRQYEQIDRFETDLPRKPSVESKIRITDEFSRWLHEDAKHSISASFLDYYVFPRIQSEEVNGAIGKESVTEDEFVSNILDAKKVLICGGYNSGKTSLLKSLFLRLSKDFSVLFCSISNLRGRVVDRMIKNCFVDTYGERESDYLRFQQTPKNKRVIIIDDVDEIKPESFESLMSQLSESFDYFLLSTKQVVDVDLVERMKVHLKASNSIHRFRILPVYSDKRHELIQMIVSIKIGDANEANKVVEQLAYAIKLQRRFISLDPDFIIKYIEYFCNNLMDAGSNDSGVFSKVFEANITYSLSPYQTPSLSVDKLFVLLSKTAHFIHFHKSYPISEKDIISIIEDYNTAYSARVNCVNAITSMQNAKILVGDGVGGYRFSDRSYLAYFVAREVNSQYQTTGNDYDLQMILKCACFGINADILMFISYITDNIKILRFILRMANELTEKWTEFDFTDNLPLYLRAERVHAVLPPTANDQCKEELAEIETERKLTTDVQTIDLYDYTEDDANRFVNQIIRAGSLLVVIAKCLPNFEHNMLKEDKDHFISAVYHIPNRIFGLWATEADKCVNDLIAFFKGQAQDFYTRESTLDDDDILRALQWVSISILLDLYHLPMFYAAKDNTAQYLSSFAYSDQDTYSLEHLLALIRVGSASAFVSEAIKLNERDKGGAFSMALRRIARHALIVMKNFDYKLRQQLEAKFFPAVEDQKRILSQRMLIESKRGE